jgi:hypothetical protein
MNLDLSLKFLTPEQEQFFYLLQRNTCMSGGYGSGKTYVACQKLVYCLSTFPNSRGFIARFEESKLRRTTMKTFYNVCPRKLYDERFGGVRADSLNYCRFFNNSELIFMHLKDYDERIIRGLEVNFGVIDQAEEIEESTFTAIAPRIGRWSEAQVPNELLKLKPDWPKLPNGNYKIPAYLMLLCNPDSELHWIYRRFHPDSEEWQNKFSKRYFMVQAETTTATIDDEVLEEMMSNDQQWIDRFVKGKWGIPGGTIHKISDDSILEVGKDISYAFLEMIIKKGSKTRVLDHGDSAATCCLWFSAYKDWHFCYREYYKENELISQHRAAINEMSEGEYYPQNLADPAIFKKTMQKYGGRWSVSDEYQDPQLVDKNGKKCPILNWNAADNDEFSTRNRISEWLLPRQSIIHPSKNTHPSPKLFFIKRNENWPNGCNQAILQLKAQKRVKVGEIDGKEIFSDERNPNIPDHAYDDIRYYCASHQKAPGDQKQRIEPGSFFDVRNQLKALRLYGKSKVYNSQALR